MSQLQHFIFLRDLYRRSMSSSKARRMAFAEATAPLPF